MQKEFNDLKSENEQLKRQIIMQTQMINDLSLINEKQHKLFCRTVIQKDNEYSKLKKNYKKLKGCK